MKKSKTKKCFCRKKCFVQCGDCYSVSFMASGQDLEDIQSALSYWIKEHKGAPKTTKAMKRILKNTWVAVHAGATD